MFQRLATIAVQTGADFSAVFGCDAAGNIGIVAAAARVNGQVATDASVPEVQHVGGGGDAAPVLALGDRTAIAAGEIARLIERLGLRSVADLYAAVAPAATTCFSLAFRDRPLGKLFVARRASGGELDPGALDFLEALAERAAAAAEHVRLHRVQQAARQRAERAEVRSKQLQRATAALAQASTPEQVAEVAVRQAMAALAAAGGRFVRQSRDTGNGTHVLFEQEATHSLGSGHRTSDDAPPRHGQPPSAPIVPRGIFSR